MQNELRYQVRSREIVDLISAMRSDRLTLSPYFQRNLVWRDAHKRDFIDTILKGYPFPQIFLARGPIDLQSMQASQCVVDGQQRLNTIHDYVSEKFEVHGKMFSHLSPKEKEDFLKYEVAVIDFDLDAGDHRIKDIFHRLNRTYYSLSAIEKISSEYSASEFLLTARVLCGEIIKDSDIILDELVDDDEAGPKFANAFLRDPGIEEGTWAWFQSHAGGPFSTLIADGPVFTSFEFDRKVPLMFTLNVMCTLLSGYYNRNDKVKKYLEDFNSVFDAKEEVIEMLDLTASFINDLQLSSESMWWNKANFFTLACELARYSGLMEIGPQNAKDRLVAFEQNVPADYALAAREAVNNKNQREIRANYLQSALTS